MNGILHHFDGTGNPDIVKIYKGREARVGVNLRLPFHHFVKYLLSQGKNQVFLGEKYVLYPILIFPKMGYAGFTEVA